MPNAAAEALKNEGNTFFKNGQYAKAVEKYQAACRLDDNQPAYWSNMAACFEKLNQFEEMADAARNCIKADRSFIKGYFRLASAQKQLNDLDGCIKTLESGLAMQASNADLKKMKKDVMELQRGEQVAAYCTKARTEIKAQDWAAAMKTLELASRLDAGNPDVASLLKTVKPKFDQMEKQRKASLSGPELYKEKGDEQYKNAQFEQAVQEYTKCLDLLKKRDGGWTSELALKALSNRAACNKQISHFDAVIEDCSAVLEVEPDNVKALIRRAQAFEGVERYRFALQDVKAVLALPFDKVGKTNFDLCNGMQHRLSRTVAQLKKMDSRG
jgi:stress-induced-phosphoprotein 1